MAERVEVLHNAFATDAVQTIAAFASLHVGITVSRVRDRAPARTRTGGCATHCGSFLFLTILATVYLGWHYFTDALGGIALGLAGVWIAAIGTGNHVRGRPVHRRIAEHEPVAL